MGPPQPPPWVGNARDTTRAQRINSVNLPSSVPDPEDFSPALNGRIHRLLADLMGDTWTRIEASDRRGREARPANPRRHLLAVLSDHANDFAQQFVNGVWPGKGLDYLAFHGIVSIMERFRTDPLFSECVAQMVTPEGFRHNMTVLGFADHITKAHQLPDSTS